MITFGVQPSTPTSTLFASPAGLASNSTADEFLFNSLTSTVVVLLVVRLGRDGVSRACIAVPANGADSAYDGGGNSGSSGSSSSAIIAAGRRSRMTTDYSHRG